MANKLEISVEIIVHATEDIKKILETMEEFFEIKEAEFSKTYLTGHFENPIIMLNTKITKNKAQNFIAKLISKIPQGELDEIINDLENRIQNSTLHLRLGKQDLIQGSITLRQKDVIKLKIFTPVYTKKDTVKNYSELLKISSC
jgi:RNA binding exosome subunit